MGAVQELDLPVIHPFSTVLKIIVMGFWSGLTIGIGISIAVIIGLLIVSVRRQDSDESIMSQPVPLPGDPEYDRDPQLDIELRLEVVPAELHEVVPIARKFGVGCDALRMEVIESASPQELSELRHQMERHWFVIQKWLNNTCHPMPDWLVPIMYARDASECIDPPVVEPSPDTH